MFNKVILITGGSSGIGKETVLKFATNGLKLFQNKSILKTLEKFIELSNKWGMKYEHTWWTGFFCTKTCGGE